MTVADTTVAVAAALRWHAHHVVARAAVAAERAPLVAHVAIETYSVLTRLPPTKRVSASLAREFLMSNFSFPVVALAPDSYERLLERAAELGLVGGALYDALVGVTAREAGATLLTLDRRAERTYQRLGVAYELLA